MRRITIVLSSCLMALMTVGAVLSCEKPATAESVPVVPEKITPLPEEPSSSPEEPGEAKATPPRELITTESAQEQVRVGLRDFSFNIFKEVSRTRTEANFVFSPFSLSMALAMAEGGAKDDTAEEMKSVLGFPGAGQDDFAAHFQYISRRLNCKAGDDLEIKVANSIWSDTGFPVLDEFKDFSEYFYEAAVRSMDFSQSSTADEINAWCSEHTNGRIPAITKPDELQDLCMCLINTLYFKVPWAIKFESSPEQPFRCHCGAETNVPMMTHCSYDLYAKNGEFTFIGIPFGVYISSGFKTYNIYSFDILLPEEGADIYGSIASLSREEYYDLVSKAASTQMNLYMPKFKIEYEAKELIKNLKSLGMKKAFDPALADFTGISSIPTYISLIKHKTFIELTEEGTEAAAATLVGMKEVSIGPEPENPITVVVDRPFIFAIREKMTNTILFIGAKTTFD